MVKEEDSTRNQTRLARRSFAQQFFSVRSHEPVWRTLRAAVMGGHGVVVVTGEAGVGKTQLLRRLQGVLPETRDFALVLDAGQSLESFTQTLCQATGAEIAGPNAWSITFQELLGAIKHRLDSGQKYLVAVDQADRLSDENRAILDELVLYSQKYAQPVQIILVGWPELSQSLNLSAFRTLQRAMLASVVVTPLTRVEVWEYIQFQAYRVLGKKIRMTWPAWLEIYAASRGNPREIDALLQQALFLIQERGSRVLTGDLVREGRMVLDSNYSPPPGKRLMPWVAVILLVLMPGYFMGQFFFSLSSRSQVVAVEKCGSEVLLPQKAAGASTVAVPFPHVLPVHAPKEILPDGQNRAEPNVDIWPVPDPKIKDRGKPLPSSQAVVVTQQRSSPLSSAQAEALSTHASDGKGGTRDAASVRALLRSSMDNMPETQPIHRLVASGPSRMASREMSPDSYPIKPSAPVPVPKERTARRKEAKLLSVTKQVSEPVEAGALEVVPQHRPKKVSNQSLEGGSAFSDVSGLASEATLQAVGQLYIVQAGSFLEKKNAEQLAFILKKNGLKPYVHLYQRDNKDWFSVRIHYRNRLFAEKVAQAVYKNTHVSTKVIDIFYK